MNERRLFFAVPISDPVRKRLVREMRNWEGLPLIPERPEFLHVTVLFLGYVPDEDVAEISDIAAGICAAHEPFEIAFSGIELRPDTDEPKMLWLAGEESEELRNLHNDFACELSEGISGSRHFRPHITLAKVKKNAFLKLPEAERERIAKPLLLSEPVSSVVLFESIGTGPKREYLPMEEFVLGESR